MPNFTKHMINKYKMLVSMLIKTNEHVHADSHLKVNYFLLTNEHMSQVFIIP